MKIVFFGMNAEFSILPFLAIRDVSDVVGVFELVDKKTVKQNLFGIIKKMIGYKSAQAYSLQKSAKVYGINYFSDELINDDALLSWLKEKRPDLICVSGFSKKISKEVLGIPRLGIINVHSGLLPKYRGAHPFFHMVRNRAMSGGVSIHWMNENFDDGDIIRIKEFPLVTGMNLSAYNTICAYMAAIELPDVLRFISTHGKIAVVPNEATGALNCFSPRTRDLIIDKTWSVQRTLWMFNAYSDRYDFFVQEGAATVKVFLIGLNANPESHALELSDGILYYNT